jgi:hypothetical protein
MTDLQRDIGRHDEAIDNLKTEVHAIRVDLAEIKALLSGAKGGWRTLVALGSIAAMIGAAIAKLIEWRGAP